MSHFLDRLTFFKKYAGSFADGHGVTTTECRHWRVRAAALAGCERAQRG